MLLRRSTCAVALAVAIVVSLVAGACSSDGGDAAPPGDTATAATLAPPAGLPAFYGVPDPLPAGAHGDLLSAEPVDAPDLHGSLWRVMYLSESMGGDPIAVTGLVAVPDGTPPEGGWPVVTWAHGTTGIADSCAPSVDPASIDSLANQLLDQGYLVAATDYEGSGTPGRHPYIAGESEGRGVLDIVTAVHQMADVEASDRYLVWGHSQGGHAALYAGHLAAEWAPDLDLVGVVAGAPPSQLLLINAALQQSPFKYYIAMAAAGLNAAYGDQAAPLDEVLTPDGLSWLANVDEVCAGGLRTAAADVDFSTLQKADPASVPAWRTILEENDPGRFTSPIPQPLLIIHGGDDEQIPVASSALLFDQLCAIGQVEQRWVYPDQSHAGVVGVSIDDMLAWVGQRFAGNPDPFPTTPVGPPAPTVQTCPAS